MTRATDKLKRPRWSDGRIVSYRQDRVALGFHLLSWASTITVTVLWMFSSRWAAWWVLIPVSAACNLSLEQIARNRLRRAVLRVEALSGAEQATVPEQKSIAGQAPVEVGLEDWFNFKLRRFDDYAIRSCDRKAEELRARAETALTNGKQRAAARYLRRAERERRLSERWRRAVGYDDRQSWTQLSR